MSPTDKPEKKKVGRPSIKSDGLIEAFLLRVMKGEAVYKICKDNGMPNQDTIYTWLRDDKDFSDKYTRAKEIAMEGMAEEIIQIADDNSRDTEAFVGINHVHRARLKVESRKWLMSKLAPKKYGDKIDVTSAGEAVKPDTKVTLIVGGESQELNLDGI